MSIFGIFNFSEEFWSKVKYGIKRKPINKAIG